MPPVTASEQGLNALRGTCGATEPAVIGRNHGRPSTGAPAGSNPRWKAGPWKVRVLRPPAALVRERLARAELGLFERADQGGVYTPTPPRVSEASLNAGVTLIANKYCE